MRHRGADSQECVSFLDQCYAYSEGINHFICSLLGPAIMPGLMGEVGDADRNDR